MKYPPGFDKPPKTNISTYNLQMLLIQNRIIVMPLYIQIDEPHNIWSLNFDQRIQLYSHNLRIAPLYNAQQWQQSLKLLKEANSYGLILHHDTIMRMWYMRDHLVKEKIINNPKLVH